MKPGHDSELTRKLEQAQETHHKAIQEQSVLYRLYTEDNHRNLLYGIVSRYFNGATFLYGNGLWQGAIENSVVIEIIASTADLQTIIHLAGDIRTRNTQQTVLISWSPVSLLAVTE